MFETIVINIEGKLVAIDVQISEETREVDGEQYHLVVNQTDSEFKYLATEGSIKSIRKNTVKASEAMTELEATL
jgi:hypothetical protein